MKTKIGNCVICGKPVYEEDDPLYGDFGEKYCDKCKIPYGGDEDDEEGIAKVQAAVFGKKRK